MQSFDFKELNPNAQQAKVFADALFYCTTLEQECDHGDILNHVMTVNDVEEEEVGGYVYKALFALTHIGALTTNTFGRISNQTIFKGNPFLLDVIHKDSFGDWEEEA